MLITIADGCSPTGTCTPMCTSNASKCAPQYVSSIFDQFWVAAEAHYFEPTAICRNLLASVGGRSKKAQLLTGICATRGVVVVQPAPAPLPCSQSARLADAAPQLSTHGHVCGAVWVVGWKFCHLTYRQRLTGEGGSVDGSEGLGDRGKGMGG